MHRRKKQPVLFKMVMIGHRLHCRNKQPLATFLFKMVFIQVVGRHFQEEVVIHAMKTIEELLKRKCAARTQEVDSTNYK